MQLKNKESGKVYNILFGKVLKPKEAKKNNVTASFIEAKAEDGEEVHVIFGYKDDGTPTEKNQYELILEKGEKL